MQFPYKPKAANIPSSRAIVELREVTGWYIWQLNPIAPMRQPYTDPIELVFSVYIMGYDNIVLRVDHRLCESNHI
jgi:hypothetical protein